MPKKCCVKNCKTGYDSQDGNIKIPKFKLPSAKTELEERTKWINVLDRVNGSWKISDDSVVCELHWPVGYSVCSRKGHQRPSNPPSVFAGGNIPNLCPPLEEEQESEQHIVVTKSLPDHSYAIEEIEL